MIKEYKVKMLVEKEITVRIDKERINEDFFKDFSSYMWDIESDEELLEHIGHCVMFNDDVFVEGLGPLTWHKKDIAGIGVEISNTDVIYDEFEIEEIKQ